MDQTHNLPLFCPQVAVVVAVHQHQVEPQGQTEGLVVVENKALQAWEVLVIPRLEAHPKVVMGAGQILALLILLEVAVVRVGLEVTELPLPPLLVMVGQESLTLLLGRQ